MRFRVRPLIPSDKGPTFTPLWRALDRFRRDSVAGRVEVFTDEEGLFVGAYAIGLEGTRATLWHFEVAGEGKRSEGLKALMERRLKVESGFVGAKSLADPNALLQAQTIELVADCRLPYAPSYCEENALLRLANFKRPTLVFATSPARATSFRFQRASLNPEDPIFWDYHVFVADEAAIYDADTTLGYPFDKRSYLEMTFADAPRLPHEHQPYFRLYSKEDAHRFVRSDRSHMKTQAGFQAPPPSWPALHDSSTLMECLAFDAPHGETLSLEAFLKWQPEGAS